jgi:lipopolysaccharide/colanic/teichoic acid biosynthesis glycosyltransferase
MTRTDESTCLPSLGARAAKRAFDLAVSAAALAFVAIPMAAVGIAVKLDSRGPVFYRGERIGRRGNPFRIFKFRSMYVHQQPGLTSTSEGDPRVTRVGRLVRKYKFDEFAQLVNVLLGDMSLVGPRPEVRKFVDKYTDEEKAILSVRPGITDWSSIKFHNEGEIIAASGYADADEAYAAIIRPEKLRLQLKYVRERTLMVDLAILWETVATLVRTRSSAEEPVAPTPTAVPGAAVRLAAPPVSSQRGGAAQP